MSAKSFPIFIILAGMILSTGCTKSLVYSPSINLPPKPLKQGESQFLAGMGSFPEARPDAVGHDKAYGGEGSFRLAVCDHVTFQFKGWDDFSDNTDVARYGFSFSMISAFNDSPDYRIGMIPMAAFLFGGEGCEGGGGGILVPFWFTKYHPIDFYASLGPVVGIKDLDVGKNEKKKWGWGIWANIGTAVMIEKHVTINFELAGIKQVNEYEGIKDYFLCPSLNIGYVFNPERERRE